MRKDSQIQRNIGVYSSISSQRYEPTRKIFHFFSATNTIGKPYIFRIEIARILEGGSFDILRVTRC